MNRGQESRRNIRNTPRQLNAIKSCHKVKLKLVLALKMAMHGYAPTVNYKNEVRAQRSAIREIKNEKFTNSNQIIDEKILQP